MNPQQRAELKLWFYFAPSDGLFWEARLNRLKRFAWHAISVEMSKGIVTADAYEPSQDRIDDVVGRSNWNRWWSHWL